MDNSEEIIALSDEQLTDMVKNGRDAAYGILADRYKPLTENAVRRFGPSFSGLEGDAVWGEDDLRQCAALALYRAAMTYDPRNRGKNVRFGLYAKICVNNALISELRRARSQARRKAVQKTGHEAGKRARDRSAARRGDPLDQLVSLEGFGALTSSIRTALTPLERDVFDRYIKGMSVEQIAGVLGRDRKSVSNALYRMKVKVKGLLQNNQ